MKLDHATVVTPHLDTVRHFFCRIVGLTGGARPPFAFDGRWLYQDGRPIIHLVKTNSDWPQTRSPSRIDHVAFRIASEDEWQAPLARLQAGGVEYQQAALPASGERQLFVVPMPGVMIEFVTAAAL